MQIAILATDGGPHPVDKWARTTAWQIVNHLIVVDENSTSALAIEARKARDELEPKLRTIMEAHHTAVQTGEQQKLATDGADRLVPFATVEARDAAVAEHVEVDAVVAAIVEETKIHPLIFDHFSKDETQAAVAAILHSHFASVIDIERDWHANGHKIVAGNAARNPDHDSRHPAVNAWHAARHPGPHPSIAEAAAGPT